MEYIIHFANVLYLVSYLVRDIFWLRAITILAIFSLIPYFYFQPTPLYAAIAWNILFAVINIYQVYLLWLERRPVFLTDEEDQLHKMAFLNLTPRAFKRLLGAGEWKSEGVGATLVAQGGERKSLMIIAEGRATVEVDHRNIADLGPGQFIGEMSFMSHDKAVADVKAVTDSRMVVWSLRALEPFLEKHPDIKAQLQLLLGHDLVRKLHPQKATLQSAV